MNRASRITASIWGILAGIGGFVHGVGEVRQGSVAPESTFIFSWTEGPIASNLGGEPAMTIVPNLFVTGILTMVVSLTIIGWSAAFVTRKHGGRVLFLLSVAMLLVGGGFAPPVIGVMAGGAGSGIHSQLTWWRSHLSPNLVHLAAKLWPWLFGICLAASLILVIGSHILVFFLAVNNADLFSNLFLFSLGMLLLVVISGFAYDIQQTKQVTA